MAVSPHVHIGFLEFAVFMLYLVIGGFLLHVLEISMHGNPIGQALSFIY